MKTTTASGSVDLDLASLETSNDAAYNARLVPLASHVLQRLLTLMRRDPPGTGEGNDVDRVCIATAAIAVATALAKMLLTDRPRLERCAHPTGPPSDVSTEGGFDSRSVVGRAVVVASLSSLAGLEIVVALAPSYGDGSAAERDFVRSSVWSALITLERLSHFGLAPPSVISPPISGVQHSPGGYASPSLHYHAAVAAVETAEAWRRSLRLMAAKTDLCVRLGPSNPAAPADTVGAAAELDAGRTASQLELGWTAAAKTSTVLLATKACNFASSALGSAFVGEIDLLARALVPSVEPNNSVEAVGEGSLLGSGRRKSKAGQRRSSKSSGTPVKVGQVSTLSCSAAFKALLLGPPHTNATVFDGRISVRRWASMALVWFGGGQKRLMQLASEILATRADTDDDADCGLFWTSVMGIGGHNCKIVESDDPTSSLGYKKRKRPRSFCEVDREHKCAASGSKETMGAREQMKRSLLFSEKNTRSTRATTKVCAGEANKDEGDATKRSSPPSNVALVAYAVRLINLTNEIGNNCGVKAPSGGMESYACDILGFAETKQGGREKTKVSRQKKIISGRKQLSNSQEEKTVWTSRVPGGGLSGGGEWVRADIRDEAVELLGNLMTAHGRCLAENFSSRIVESTDEVCRHVLVNSDIESTVQDSSYHGDGVLLHPYIPRAVDTLTRCAASAIALTTKASSPGNLSSASLRPDSSIDCMNKLTAIASALAIGGGAIVISSTGMRNSEDAVSVIVDARLASMSICVLSDCLKRILTASSGGIRASRTTTEILSPASSNRMPALLVETYNLDSSLVPDSDHHWRNVFPNYEAVGLSSYGGVLGDMDATSAGDGAGSGSSLDDGHALALFLRGIKSTGDKSSKEAPANLLMRLLHVVDCCYSVSSVNSSTGTQLKFCRSALAADTLDTLRRSLSFPSDTCGESSLRMQERLRRSLRAKGLNLDHTEKLVRLGFKLDDAVLRRRIYLREKPGNDDGEGQSESSVSSQREGLPDYESSERRLFSSHVKLCLVVGRGTTAYVSSNCATRSKPKFGDSELRLSTFQAIGKASNTYTQNSLAWPLCLPPVQHALVTSNMSSEVAPEDTLNAAPELFICESFIAALVEMMSNLESLPLTTTAEGRTSTPMTIADNIPLSLRDARLFVLALLRVPKNDQTKFIPKLIDVLYSEGKGMKRIHHATTSNPAISSFLARVVTLIVTSVDAVRGGRHLLDNMSIHTGPEHYSLPNLSQNETGNSDDWYRRDSSFMGLFSDWESQTVPVPSVVDGTEPLTKGTMNKLIRSLLALFDVSFLSARKDRCHLLFASWNALSSCSAWDAKFLSELLSEGQVTNDVQHLIELREDMFAVHKRILGEGGFGSETVTSQLLQKKNESKYRNKTIQEALTSSMDVAVSIADSVTAVIKDNEPDKIPSSTTAVCEATAVQLSFLVSLYTRSDKGISSYYADGRHPDAQRRKGSGNSDSFEEGGMSSDESRESDYDVDDEDERIDSLSRLHESCKALGVAPLHPDWLDTNVRLRLGISSQVATEGATRALEALTKIANSAESHRMKSLELALALGHRGNTVPNMKECAESALGIHSSLRYCSDSGTETKDSGDSALDANELISTALGVNKTCLASFSTLEYKSEESVKEAWVPNAAQRIHGSLQECGTSLDGWEPNNCELRATGEWEMLMADALIGTSIDIKIQEDQDSADSVANKATQQPNLIDMQNRLSDALRWQRVSSSCAEAMVSTAALLRFGLNLGRGRPPHPLSKKESEACFDIEVDYPSSPLPSNPTQTFGSITRDDIKRVVSVSLAFISGRVAESEPEGSEIKIFRASSCHLLGDLRQIEALEDLFIIRSVFIGIFALEKALSRSTEHDCSMMINFILPKLVKSLEARAVSDVDDIDGKHTMGGVHLLASLGFRNILKVDTILERSVNAVDLLSLAQNASPDNAIDRWQWATDQTNAIGLLLQMLCATKFAVLPSTKATIASLLKTTIDAEARHISKNVNLFGMATVVRSSLSRAWDELESNCIEEVIRNDLCLVGVSSNVSKESKEASKNLSLILMRLACSAEQPTSPCDHYFAAARALIDSMHEWLDRSQTASPSITRVIELLCILATRCDLLVDTGTRLLKLVSEMRSTDRALCQHHWAIEVFFRYLYDLHRMLVEDETISKVCGIKGSRRLGSQNEATVGIESNGVEYCITAAGAKVRSTCSFVETGGDFKEQHWYNCYTCGLLWDKGCCSLCAVVCHKDHDVGYSRKSSFFCDCGAENASASENNRVPCGCLSPLSSGRLRTIYEPPRELAIEARNGSENLHSKANPIENLPFSLSKAITMIVSSCSIEAKASIEGMVSRVGSLWRDSLFKSFDASFSNWCEAIESSEPLLKPLPLPKADSLVESKSAQILCSPKALDMKRRSGRVLSLEKIKGATMVSVRSAKSHSLSMKKLCNDSATDRIKKALLSKNDIRRNALVADSRGRLAIAESGSILFCSAFPLVNVRYVNGKTPIDRSQLCRLGSFKTEFTIVGMALCRENERHLAVWGTGEGAVLILSQNFDKVEKKIDLAVDLEPQECENDYVLKFEWVPSSETLVATICSTFIKVFDLKRSVRYLDGEGLKCMPSKTYASEFFHKYRLESLCAKLQFLLDLHCTFMPLSPSTVSYEDALIRSAAVIPLNKPEKDGTASTGFALLFDSGRLQVVSLSVHSNGVLVDQGETYIDSVDTLSFPTEGVRRYSGATPGALGSRSSSFGEGASLEYLEQSGLLLYKCISSCVVALILDRQTGTITGSFELLPQIISSTLVGSGVDGYSISAPYQHWTELGLVEKAGTSLYRLACTGKSTRTNQPKVLMIEYNSTSVQMKELNWLGASTMGLGLSLNTSFEGSAAFSAPQLRGRMAATGECGVDGEFIERVFLVSLTSNGSMLIFGDEFDPEPFQSDEGGSSTLGACSRFREINQISTDSKTFNAVPAIGTSTTIGANGVAQPKFPLTIFETLLNVSNDPRLILAGDGVGDDQVSIKRKLSINNGEFFLAPSRDGCTLTVSLLPRPWHSAMKIQSKSLSSVKETLDDSLAIVAVRLLVGSTTTDYIPREVAIMGRVAKLNEGVKRWYDLPLTDEEIMLGIRNGFVSLNFSESFDSSNNPLIDAMEVYALPKETIPFFTRGGDPTKGKKLDDRRYSPNRMSLTSKGFLEAYEKGVGENLLQTMLSAVYVASLTCAQGGTQESEEVIRGMILRSLQVTSLQCKTSRKKVVELLEMVDYDEKSRQELIDKGSLCGVDQALAGLRKIAGKVLERGRTDTFDLPSMLSALADCLALSLEVAQNRPSNYAKAHLGFSDCSGKRSLSLSAKAVLDRILQSAPFGAAFALDDIPCIAGDVIELGIRELGLEWAEGIEVSSIDLVSDLLRSSDAEVVRSCSDRIVCAIASLKKNENAIDIASGDDSDKPPIAYQCDSCKIFPIQRVRYALEGGHDIDLCQICYDIGVESTKSASANDVVCVNGKTFVLSNGTEMTCSELRSMKQLAITDKILEEVRKAEQEELASTSVDSARDDGGEAVLQLALKMPLDDHDQKANLPYVNIDTVVSPTFCKVLELVTQSLIDSSARDGGAHDDDKESLLLPHTGPLLNLLLCLVTITDTDETQIQRGKRLSDVLCQIIKNIIGSDPESTIYANSKHVTLLSAALQTLSNLVSVRLDDSSNTVKRLVDAGANSGGMIDVEKVMQGNDKNKDKTDPRFICHVHGVPAVRRRCSKGVHKDRRFYVCGMQRKLRCKYFKWADEKDAAVQNPRQESGIGIGGGFPPEESQGIHQGEPSAILKAIRLHVFILLSDAETPLESRLCMLLNRSFQRIKPGGLLSTSTHTDSTVTSSDTLKFGLESLKTDEVRVKERNDGVINSKSKLRNQFFVQAESLSGGDLCSHKSCDQDSSIVFSCLDLLGSVVSAITPLDSGRRKGADWFPLLCDIISTSASSSIRAAAKQLMKRLCGSKGLYHKVRDHYLFGSKYQLVLQSCIEPLQAALVVKERARQCGTAWREKALDWRNMRIGGLIGTCDLISEDVCTVKTLSTIKKRLNDLFEVAKSRENNWMHFCALPNLPLSHSWKDENVGIYSQHPPIVTLFWIACSVPTHDTEALKLVELALSGPFKEMNHFIEESGISDGKTDTVTNNNELAETQAHRAAKVGDVDAIRAILERGENGSFLIQDEKGWQPLHEAARGGFTEIAEILIEYGADVNARSHNGRGVTPLWLVVKHYGEDHVLTKLLENCGGKKVPPSPSEPLHQLLSLRESQTPEEVLFNGESGLTFKDVYAFVMCFVLRGKSAEVRAIARKVGQKLCTMLPPVEIEQVFSSLINSSLGQVQPLGRCSLEYFKLLHELACDRQGYALVADPSVAFIRTANVAVRNFTHQLRTTIQVLRDNNSSIEIESSRGKMVKETFDLSSCVHCHCDLVARLRADSDSGDSSLLESARTSTAEESSRAQPQRDSQNVTKSKSSLQSFEVKWANGQVRPYTKSRLEALSDSSTSGEFTSYARLKGRMAVREIHLSVSDPRGRLVKTVAVYFSPRHVEEVSDLKGDDYLPHWQHCGNFCLSRGANRSSLKLFEPVVAANLKFEYAEFYDRSKAAGRSSEGVLILHCPRCTRAVNNAHGVCGHCGEVAFQCRKCRHINYDKLDAFLCIECGYCSSGGFSYELTAGLASNAVAITSDEDYDRLVKLLRSAAKRQADLRDSKLRRKIFMASSSTNKRSRDTDFDELTWHSSYSPQMKRAMLGGLPKNGGKGVDDGHRTSKGSPTKRNPAGQGDDRAAAADKARSLLSLARQLRSDPNDEDQFPRNDMLVRQALLDSGGSGAGSFDMMDDPDADMLSMLNRSESAGLGLDIRDPLSRLVSDIQARVRGGRGENETSRSLSYGQPRRGEERDGRGDSDRGVSAKTVRGSTNRRDKLEELRKIYQQMREEESECFELSARLDAWTRLNRDGLVDSCSSATVHRSIFTPTACRSCCGPVTLSMLLLVTSIIQHAEAAVTHEFIRYLFEEPPGMDGDLLRCKRLAIATVAFLSSRCADMVLQGLQLRLKAFQDVGSAEILGSILAKSSELKSDPAPFIQLAEDLLSGHLSVPHTYSIHS